MKKRELTKLLPLLACLTILILGIGIQIGYSWEGSTGNWTPGYFEEENINATTEFYRAGDNYTAWIDDTYLLDDGSESLGGSLTTEGINVGWIDLDTNRTTWPTMDAIPPEYDYFIDKNATHHRVWDGRPGEVIIREDLTDANLDTAIENCMGDDAGRIAIKLGPNCDGTGRTLTIDRSQVSIYTGLNHDDQGTMYTPMISRILFEGDGSTELKNVYIQGLSTQEWDFHAKEYSIQAIYSDQCYIRTDATYKGIIFRDTNTGPGDPFIDWIKFVDLSINDRRDQTGPNSGAISWECSDDGTGQFWFERLKYHASQSDNQVFMCFEAGRVSPTIWVDKPTFELHNDEITLVKVKSGAFVYSLIFDSPWMEVKENFTMIEIDNGAERTKIIMDNSVWSLGTLANITLIDNGNTALTDWSASSHNGLYGEGNIISTVSTWTGTFDVGTLYLNRRFSFQWSYAHRYYNTTSSRYIRMDHGYLSLSGRLLADHFFDGITSVGNLAGGTFYFNDVVYLTSGGDYEDTDADAAATMPVMGMHVETETVSGFYMRLLKQGFVTDYSWTLSPIGGFVYASTTAGEITDTAPSGSGDQVQILGYIYSSNTIYFDPDYTITEIP